VYTRGMARTPKVRVPLRLDAELAAWADGWAESSGLSRTAVYEKALGVLRAWSLDDAHLSASVSSAPAGRVARPSGSPSAARRVVEPSPAGVVDDVVPAAVPASVLSRAERFRRATQGS
jgi:hypothetical protein